MTQKVDAKFVQRVKDNMVKARGKAKRPTVKGPQLVSRVLLARKRKAEPERTARLTSALSPVRARYIEPPTKPDGNPFFAFRVRGELLAAFRKEASKRYPKAPTPNAAAIEMVRAYMAKATGVSAEADNDGE